MSALIGSKLDALPEERSFMAGAEFAVHVVKCWPEQFGAIIDGRKTFEVRMNDRNYQEGDCLLEQEFDPDDYRGGGRGYTGRECKVLITYLARLGSIPGLPVGLVAMSITVVEKLRLKFD